MYLNFYKNSNRDKSCQLNGRNSTQEMSNFSAASLPYGNPHKQVTSLSNESNEIELQNLKSQIKKLQSDLDWQRNINKNLKQTLEDERTLYNREKEYFNGEMEKHRNKCNVSASNINLTKHREFDKIEASLNEEIQNLKDELFEKNNVINNLCIKYIRMQHSRNVYKEKFEGMYKKYWYTTANIMQNLDEAKNDLNIIFSSKSANTASSLNKYIEVMQKNSQLLYENAALKLQKQQLLGILEKIKSKIDEPQMIEIDMKSLAKLSETKLESTSEEDSSSYASSRTTSSSSEETESSTSESDESSPRNRINQSVPLLSKKPQLRKIFSGNFNLKKK